MVEAGHSGVRGYLQLYREFQTAWAIRDPISKNQKVYSYLNLEKGEGERQESSREEEGGPGKRRGKERVLGSRYSQIMLHMYMKMKPIIL